MSLDATRQFPVRPRNKLIFYEMLKQHFLRRLLFINYCESFCLKKEMFCPNLYVKLTEGLISTYSSFGCQYDLSKFEAIKHEPSLI